MKTLETYEILQTGNTLGALLLSSNVVGDVVKTERFQKDRNVDVSVTFNGVEIDPDSFSEILEEHLKKVERTFKDKYSDIEQEVQRRVKEQVEDLFESQVQTMIRSFQDLQDKVQDVNDIVKYKWEV